MPVGKQGYRRAARRGSLRNPCTQRTAFRPGERLRKLLFRHQEPESASSHPRARGVSPATMLCRGTFRDTESHPHLHAELISPAPDPCASTHKDRSRPCPSSASKLQDKIRGAHSASKAQMRRRHLAPPATRVRANVGLHTSQKQILDGSDAHRDLRCERRARHQRHVPAAVRSRTCVRVRGGRIR